MGVSVPLPRAARHEVAALLRAAGPALGHEHRRVLLLDERRSGKRLAQLRAVDNVDLAPGAVQENPAPQTPSPTGGKSGLLLLDAGQLPGRSHTQSDDLHRVVRVGVGEALPVQRVETGDKQVERLGVEAPVAQQHHQLERLAAVAHVGRKAELSRLCRDAVLVEQARALASQLGEGAFDFRQVFRNRSQNSALREVVHDCGMENAARRKRARIGREDYPVDAELLGDWDGMQAPGATEGQKAERARIEALLKEAEPNRRGEACIGEGEDALSGALRVEPERARDMRLDRGPSALDIERKRSAEEEFGIETAERQVRVRHRRLRAAAAITNRPRTRAGAARTDDEAPAWLDRGDRAAAGADGADLYHRQTHRQAVDLPLRHQRRLAVLNDADVEARAAHIDADEVREAEPGAGALSRERSAARAGQQKPHRLLARELRAAHATVRLH